MAYACVYMELGMYEQLLTHAWELVKQLSVLGVLVYGVCVDMCMADTKAYYIAT